MDDVLSDLLLIKKIRNSGLLSSEIFIILPVERDELCSNLSFPPHLGGVTSSGNPQIRLCSHNGCLSEGTLWVGTRA
jgi:hypothetical protein